MLLWPRKQEVSESPPVLLGFASLESGKDTEGRGWRHNLWDPRALLKFLGLEKDIALGHGLQELTLHPASCVPGPWLVLLSWGHKKALKPLIPGFTMASQVKGVLLFSNLVCVCVCALGQVQALWRSEDGFVESRVPWVMVVKLVSWWQALSSADPSTGLVCFIKPGSPAANAGLKFPRKLRLTLNT